MCELDLAKICMSGDELWEVLWDLGICSTAYAVEASLGSLSYSWFSHNLNQTLTEIGWKKGQKGGGIYYKAT